MTACNTWPTACIGFHSIGLRECLTVMTMTNMSFTLDIASWSIDKGPAGKSCGAQEHLPRGVRPILWVPTALTLRRYMAVGLALPFPPPCSGALVPRKLH